MKIARRVLSMLHDDALIGDIEEEYLARRREIGSRAAFRWYCREVAMAIVHTLTNTKLTMKQPLTFTLALGVAGGLALALYVAFDAGQAGLAIYALVPVLSAIYLRLVPIERFAARFGVGAGSFALATVIVYIALDFILGLGRISLWGHTWRLGLFFAIGSGLAASIAQIMKPNTTSDGKSARHSIASVLALGAFGGGALFVSLFGRKMWWVPAIAACALILLIATWYLSRQRIAGFWSRYAITVSSYVLAMAIVLAIAGSNHRVNWTWISRPLTIGLLGGFLLSFLVARLTAPEPAAT